MKLDRRRKYYLVLDCETATLPYCATITDNALRQKIAIAKPLIYDLGWKIIDSQGREYARRNFLITEIFSVPQVFNTAYYAHKRPLYLEKLRNGEITLITWNEAAAILEEDLQCVESVGAYNSMFDFKKAIPFTELYITMLYSNDFYEWEKRQNQICDDIICGKNYSSNKDFEPCIFRFHNQEYKLFDIWGLACKTLLNNDNFRETARQNEWYSHSKQYYSTTAETAFRYLMQDYEFSEAHTAIDDADIESKILAMYFKKVKPKNMIIGIIYFPFKIIGKIETE